MGCLSNFEKETAAVFNESEALCEVFTYSARLKRRLAALVTERPGEIKLVRSTPDGAEEYHFPKSWLKINPSRILSDEQREDMAAAARERFGYTRSSDGDDKE